MVYVNEKSIKYLPPQSTEWSEINREIPAEASEKEKEKINAQNESDRMRLNDILLTSLQMQNLMVLSGSGTSCGSKIKGPSMKDLWNSIRTLNVSKSKYLKRTEIAKKINYRGKNIEEFLSQCEAFLQIRHDEEVLAFYNKSKETILKKCSFELSERNLEAHKTFLYKLSRRRARDSRLKIFTTNYDLCFETAASYQGLIAIDGFSFTQPRKYDPRYFNYDIVWRPHTSEESVNYLEGVFHLYKLHGSVNWANINSKNAIIIKEKPGPSEACLIYPAEGKYQQSYNQPYLEIMAQYLSLLREPNTCLLVIGFGFNDKHLAEPIVSAVSTNPHLRLIVVDFCAYKNIEEVRSQSYWHKLRNLAHNGFDIWFINSSFDDFVNLIPDLRALTPAEQLVKNIRSLIGGNYEY